MTIIDTSQKLRGACNMKKYREVIEMGFSSERELNDFLSIIEKAGTWNNEHKVLNVSELNPGADGYRGGFQVDLVTMSICG